MNDMLGLYMLYPTADGYCEHLVQNAPMFPELRAAKHLDVLRNCADKEPSLACNKRMSNKEQQT